MTPDEIAEVRAIPSQWEVRLTAAERSRDDWKNHALYWEGEADRWKTLALELTEDESLILQLRAEVARLHGDVASLRRVNHQLFRQLGEMGSVADAAEREAREHLEREA